MKNNILLPYSREARELSIHLRKNMTPQEKLFWRATKSSKLGDVIRRQMPILDYVVDFYIKDIGLAIEIDGKIHENNVLEDSIRQTRIEKLGVRFVRFTNDDIENNLLQIIENLKDLICKMRD